MSISNETIEIFEINTDAYAINRGFYYQYIVLLKKWVENYISDSNIILYSEVDDDIKEVGDHLIFNQVKCYSSNLSFSSPEVKKALFNYYILYLKYHSHSKIGFCFSTNTGIKPREKLLIAWEKDPTLSDGTIKLLCINKIKKIIQGEIKNRKQKKIEKLKERDVINRTKINSAAQEILNKIDNSFIETFISSVKWDFLSSDPISAINNLFSEVRTLLTDAKFKNKPVVIIESVLLGEIYKCSQLPDKNDRILSNKIIDSLLSKTDHELKTYINNELIDLLGLKFHEIDQKFLDIDKLHESHKSSFQKLNTRISVIENLNLSRKIPKELTSLPFILNESIYGRDKFILEIKRELDSTRILSISGSGGVGKTTCANKFIMHFYNEFDHIIWINSSQSLLQTFVWNQPLIQSLNLSVLADNSLEDNFKIICNTINSIDGNNILVLDNYQGDLINLKTILSITKFKILITTREKIQMLKQSLIPQLDFESALEVYKNNLNRTVEDETNTIEDFFTFINFNPLIIELCAKTISNSIDVNLKSLRLYFTDQDLENENLKIDVAIFSEDYPVRLLSYLKKKFAINNLTSEEKHFIGFLALLPSEEIVIDEISQIGGKEFYDKNKSSIVNILNSLQVKGWIERKENVVKMQPFIQQIIIYEERNSINPFISQVFMIIWLCHRIDEVSQINPRLSFKFLKYAESILSSIKEPFRERMYQPLLLLENALLNSYNWLENSKTLHSRWIDLLKRSVNHLEKSDKNLGIIYHNVGHSYYRQKDFENAELNFSIAIEILEKEEGENINPLLLTLNNLSFLYSDIGKIDKAQSLIKKTDKLSKKYSQNNSQNNSYHHFLNGLIAKKSGDLIEALNSFEKAIKIHLLVEEENRNDLLLAIYYANLIHSLYKLGKHDKVKSKLILLTKLLKKLDDFENEIIKGINNLILELNSLY